jgi:hypothetical protein
MNSKQIKKLRKLIKPLQVEWLQSILPEDQGKVITVDNVDDLLPDEKTINAGGQRLLSYMSDGWVLKMLKKYPQIKTYQDLQNIEENKNG